ncbi:carboxyl transferase domain-containing protein [Undibacterium terreum]|uniref:carboxyl transferase domain-containing protein n=1 Tax=Undibacterium terreum TaxID=1224302 RepID=UPI00166E23AA|nr:carboxyl transferase domain-containing protein [Undibacterium terreum]
MFNKILIANRGEIALRILRAARDLGIASVAVYAQDDAHALHVASADQAIALNATGAAAYLDVARLISIAQETGCDAIHPGYGFLSERADFAQACADAGIRFIGPDAAHLDIFGDKAKARELAQQCKVPLIPGTGAVTLEQAQAFFAALPAGNGAMIKAIGGGGGRGMRVVQDAAELPAAYARCVSEAHAAFGVDSVYLERLITHARHIEIQIAGDGDQVMALGDRECTLQRRFQKLVEIAPSPTLSAELRRRITDAALELARQVRYRSLGTFEFLVDDSSGDLPFVFIEANPRLQVEHTVTEEVTGIDLVQLQIRIAAGDSLADCGLDPSAPPQQQGFAMQLRINAETVDAQGNAFASGGSLEHFDLPSGPGVRVDTHGYAGYAPSPHYDTLLAKLIVSSRSPQFSDLVRRARRVLDECRITGMDTNLPLLRALAARPEFAPHEVHTRFVEQHLPELLQAAAKMTDKHGPTPAAKKLTATALQQEDFDDTLITSRSPMPAKLVQIAVKVGDTVTARTQLAVIEAMKMEHVVLAESAGRILEIRVQAGEFLSQGQVLILLEPVDAEAASHSEERQADIEHIRPDLQKIIDRHAYTLDINRPAAVDKRHAQGGRTARENIADLCDDGSFIEYGALAIAAQTRRRTIEDLIANTPADGMVTGLGSINGALFGAEKSRCAVLAYDYTVLAGTQGMRNHHKTDRLLALAHQLKVPVVLFAEGGGGRPGDTDMPIVAGLNNHTFSQFAALSGKVPVVGIVHGRCFAGNAALLGCSDVIIATASSNIGMSGPAMIEGGGLGTYRPEEIGPSNVQTANGVIDILVPDEAHAVKAAKQYLSYFQGRTTEWECADQRLLRNAIPENRLRVYDVRKVMQALVDTGSQLEVRAGFGAGLITALARIEGRPVGIVANNPKHLGGAIDVEAADKAARFMQLCNAHGLPIVSLTDTPGFMVGPDIEAQAQVRHVCRMFVIAAHLRVPYFTVVLRKGYGLGAQAMAAGGFDAPVFTVSWPTGEFGAMGLEGAVRLGYKKELEAAPTDEERDALFRKLVAQQYKNGEATNMAATLEIDAVIDPADTRAWLVRGLQSAKEVVNDGSLFVDTW